MKYFNCKKANQFMDIKFVFKILFVCVFIPLLSAPKGSIYLTDGFDSDEEERKDTTSDLLHEFIQSFTEINKNQRESVQNTKRQLATINNRKFLSRTIEDINSSRSSYEDTATIAGVWASIYTIQDPTIQLIAIAEIENVTTSHDKAIIESIWITLNEIKKASEEIFCLARTEIEDQPFTERLSTIGIWKQITEIDYIKQQRISSSLQRKAIPPERRRNFQGVFRENLRSLRKSDPNL